MSSQKITDIRGTVFRENEESGDVDIRIEYLVGDKVKLTKEMRISDLLFHLGREELMLMASLADQHLNHKHHEGGFCKDSIIVESTSHIAV